MNGPIHGPRHLMPGERVVWEGQPPAGIMLTATDALMIPFSLLWGGFALFWNISIWASGGPIFFRLWGLPFLAVGFYMVIGRFFADAWVRGRTRYLVTSQRVAISRANGARVKSLDIRRLPALELQEGRNGRGTIRFGESVSAFAYNRGAMLPSADPTPQFIGIDDAQAVYMLIRKQAEG